MKVSKKTTAGPQEDPAIAEARAREQQRADSAYIQNTQTLLDDETRRRARRFGRRIALTGSNPASGGSPFGSGSGGSIPLSSFDPGSFDPGGGFEVGNIR